MVIFTKRGTDLDGLTGIFTNALVNTAVVDFEEMKQILVERSREALRGLWRRPRI